MSCFTKMSTVSAASDLDLTKHVNYTAGMILGVDDFTQEFAYLSGRDRWLARDALGYGTVSGLSVRIEEDAEKGQRVMVTPGVAISPRGQLICVSATQCAYLNQWLAAAKPEDLLEWINDAGSPPVISSPSGDAELMLYVVLCYRDCLTDNVPIPGEPCRNSDELMADSRVKDDFSLELRFEPPKQLEEEAVRKYCDFLKQITISDDSSSTPIEDFLDAIRDEFLPSSPPTSSSPPLVLQIHPEDVAEYIRLAFRLWVTELRNVLSERETGCAVEMTGGKKLEDCVLLAELRIPLEFVSPGWKVSDDEDVEVIEDDRPFLLHLRMLQEWMLNEPNDHGALTGLEDDDHPQYLLIDGSRAMTGNLLMGNHLIRNVAAGQVNGDVMVRGQGAGGDLRGAYPSPRIARLQTHTLSAQSPLEGQLLVFRNRQWVTETFEHGNLAGLNDDDHPQYLLVNGSRAMIGDLKMGARGTNHRITNLEAGEADTDAANVGQIISNTDTANGDVTGLFSNLRVDKLQSYPLVADAPTDGNLLILRNGRWVTGNDLGGMEKISGVIAGTVANDVMVIGQEADGDLTGNYPNPRIKELQGNPVDAKDPKENDVLIWNGRAWVPGSQVPTPGNTPSMILPLATITRTEDDSVEYEIWFHIDAPENSIGIIPSLGDEEDGDLKGVYVEGEINQGRFLEPIPSVVFWMQQRNIFRVRLEKEMAYMRFNFILDEIRVSLGRDDITTLGEYARQNSIKFIGSKDKTATVFVRGNPRAPLK